MSLKYFGTDGIRGRAFEPPLAAEDVCRWGAAWASVAKGHGAKTLVMGWDGRTSCEPFVRAFLAGLGDGMETLLLGIAPTPAVAWVTSRCTGAWGVVISASHNPPEDNGIKGFDSMGAKLPDGTEQAIESAFDAMADAPSYDGESPDLTIRQGDMEKYLTHLGGMHFPDSFPIVVDCAHGATAPWAPRLFTGAVQWLGTPADGDRINVGVGSMHLNLLHRQALAANAAAAVAFDGDGDRCLILDDKGDVVDGDQMLWLLAQEMKRRGADLPGVVGTVMSNGGLAQSLEEMGIPFVRTPIGDKFMARELDSAGWGMAAEASGHLIQRHVGPSGDGMATALAVLRIIIKKPAVHRWDWRFEQWPLQLVNIEAPQRKDLDRCPALQRAISEAKQKHGDSVRLVIRWSGTEPLLRLMAEAREQWRVEQVMESLAGAAKADLLP